MELKFFDIVVVSATMVIIVLVLFFYHTVLLLDDEKMCSFVLEIACVVPIFIVLDSDCSESRATRKLQKQFRAT